MILIGLGSSLPYCGLSPQEIIAFAIKSVSHIARPVAVSRYYASPAWPDASDPPFVNAVIRVRTETPPARLLAQLHGVEAAFGRTRSRRNAPRTLDLDLLAYGRQVSDGRADGTTLPHPGIADRDFVLAPLCDFAPGWTCPASGLTARQMLAALRKVTVRPLSP